MYWCQTACSYRGILFNLHRIVNQTDINQQNNTKPSGVLCGRPSGWLCLAFWASAGDLFERSPRSLCCQENFGSEQLDKVTFIASSYKT